MVIKPLTIEQRVEIDDELSAYYYKLGVDTSNIKEVLNAPPSLKIALKAVKYACDPLPEDLDNAKLIELFVEVQNKSHLSDEQKKS